MSPLSPPFLGARPPRWAVHVSLALGTLLVEAIIVASDDATGPYSVLYLLVATCAFCFLTRLEAILQAALVVTAYAAGLIIAPIGDGSGGSRWVLFALVLAAGGAFIGALRVKHDRLLTELRAISRVDPDTGLLGRRGFDEAMASELERARRSDIRFGLLVGAIDGYEAIPVRERRAVLALTADALNRAKRGIDTAARIGDAEFAVIATYTDERGAAVLADRMRAVVRDALLGRATMSAGVVCHPRHGTATDVLVGAARDALAEAGRLGGDRSVIAVSAADSIAARVACDEVQVVQLG